MDKMLMAVFNTEEAAYEGLSALKDLHRSGDITLYASAVIKREPSGTVTVKQAAEEGPTGTALGALTGGLVGLLAGPVGAGLGLSVGAVTGMFIDLAESGINVDFVDEMSKGLTPGKAAVLAEVQETWETPVDTKLQKLGGVVIRRLRSDVVEDEFVRESAEFETELKLLRKELERADAESKAAVQAQIDRVQKRLDDKRTKAKARAEHAKRETDAKVEALRDQMKHLHDRQKAKVEKRIEEVKERHAVRSAKLKEARELIKEALTA